MLLHVAQLLHDAGSLVHLHVHLETLFRGQVVHGGFFTPLSFGLDGLVNTTQQVESLLVEVFLVVVERRGFHTTLHSLTGLSLVHIVLESTDVQITCGRVLALLQCCFSPLLEILLGCLLRTDIRTAHQQVQHKNQKLLSHILSIKRLFPCKSRHLFPSLQIFS